MPMIEHDWRDRAACRFLPKPEADKLFFVGQGGKSAKAKRFCAESNCPVRRSCYFYAVLYDEWGIWAGTTEAERKVAPPELKAALREEAIYYNRLESRNLDDFLEVVRNASSEQVAEPVEDSRSGIRSFLDSFSDALSGLQSAIPACQ